MTAILAVAALLATTQAMVAQSPANSAGLSTIGVNITGDWLFADAIRQARPHWDGTGQAEWGNAAAKEDSDNWPTEDASLLVWEGRSYNDGTYHLTFNGKAKVSVSFGFGKVDGAPSSTGTYDDATNTTSATVVITDKGFENCSLVFTDTQRDAGHGPNSGITNVHLWRPVSEGATTSYPPGTFFTDQTIAMSKLFSTTRFMGILDINNSTITRWSDRTLPGTWNQNDEYGDGSQARGIAYEYAVAYCNATGNDLYLNVPDGANLDPSYYTNLADLIKYGSDGTNTPITKPTDNLPFPPLKPNLHVYLEYSNEVWNSGFKQFHNNVDAVTADQKANNAEYGIVNYDGAVLAGNIYTGAWRRIAYQALLLSNAFRAVYGDAAMPRDSSDKVNPDPTIRPLLMFQATNGQATGTTELQFLDSYFNNSDGQKHVPDPHPVSYYFWGAGAATYFNSNNDLAGSVDDLFNSGMPSKDYAPMVQIDTALAKGYGLKRVAYEAGWSPQNPPAAWANKHGSAAQLAKYDPRAATAEHNAEIINQQTGVDLNMFFTSSGWNVDAVWAMTNEIFDLNPPLYQAIKTIDTTPVAALTYGNPIAGGSGVSTDLTIAPGKQGPLFSSNTYGWLIPVFGWVPLVSVEGEYRVTLNVSPPASTEYVAVILDGMPVGGVITVPPNSPSTIDVGTVNLTAGQHGLIVQGQYQSTNSYNDKGGYNFRFVTGLTLTPK